MIFLNLTADRLERDQAEEVEKLYPGCRTLELQDEIPRLFRELQDCPMDTEWLSNKYKRLKMFLGSIVRDVNEREKLVLHGPVGSPAFQALFFMNGNQLAQQFKGELKIKLEFVFSHWEDATAEEEFPDGSVEEYSYFKFIGFTRF